jgi:anti-sigma-K factor RskA
VVWHAVAGGHLFVANLPRAPEGKAYELWTIGEGAPRPAGLFQVDARGRGSHRVEPVAGGAPVKVFAVTLEPEGGVPAPTGPMVLASAK